MTICQSNGSGRWATVAATAVMLGYAAGVTADIDTTTRDGLSKFMNSVPPSKAFLCVGPGPEDRMLHPDRAPHTQLAQQDGVILFSGAAPQLGLNFTLRAGSLVYRNQMSTLGSPEPAPQVGTAGTLQQHSWDFFLPWTEARWHPGEDISWHGYRYSAGWLAGQPYWAFEQCPHETQYYPAMCDAGLTPAPHSPTITCLTGGTSPRGIQSSFNLQLARGLYQASKVAGRLGALQGECPFEFREPWFQARGLKPAFNKKLFFNPDETGDSVHIAGKYFPNYHNIYTYETLELDGGSLSIDFERSATWPRQDVTRDANGRAVDGGAVSGASVARRAVDAYENQVIFDRVPKYGWETDYKIPPWDADLSHDTYAKLIPKAYGPTPNAWRLPHKRLRTVELFSADAIANGDEPEWTIAFVYEHPDSDRISPLDTPWKTPEPWREWKSIYSHLPQSEWEFGRLPELLDETTLLTVQAYRRKDDETAFDINGAPFRDDLHVWGSTTDNVEPWAVRRKINVRDTNDDGFPGERNHDDDGDGLIDEDSRGNLPYLYNDDPEVDWDCATCQAAVATGDTTVEMCWSNPGTEDAEPLATGNEDDLPSGDPCLNPRYWAWLYDNHGTDVAVIRDPLAHLGDDATPPTTVVDRDGDTNGDEQPGEAGVDDDGDGLIDEDTNGYQAYLKVGRSDCAFCQDLLQNGTTIDSRCYDDEGVILQSHDHSFEEEYTDANNNHEYDDGEAFVDLDGDGTWDSVIHCDNPLYWRPGATGNDPKDRMDPFAHWDDDEDGMIDEDGTDNPLLVHIRAIHKDDICAAGKHPFLPATAGADGAVMPDSNDRTAHCLPVEEAASDPWVYQVQYVYARSNPYWLLSARDGAGNQVALEVPKYYYHPPFTEPFNDANNDGIADAGEFVDINNNGAFDEFAGNVHPDCLPHPDFRGPQGRIEEETEEEGVELTVFDPVAPSGINLIKRIVRVRDDIANPDNYVERVWLYRYNDAGFLKAVFDPPSVQAILDADENLNEPDDILRLADTAPVGPAGAQQALIMYASTWYTYYNPYMLGDEGIPDCYDEPPFVGDCADHLGSRLDLDNPMAYLPVNGCDGEYLWQDGYSDEMHTDPDCSDLVRNDCGACFARLACGERSHTCPDPICSCYDGVAFDATMLTQLGIPGAQPRFRKYLIKTARVRGGDGGMHLYRFDYLGAASSVYAGAELTSYADPHNITIVDEIVEQTDEEIPGDVDERNDFYIYEDEFRLTLDAAETRDAIADGYDTTSHYLYMPAKVKTRRVVVMNYYGIALSDRLILTPGYDGIQTSLVDDQQYELVNKRGQTGQVFDESWVAALRDGGQHAVKTTGRVLTQLFGGEGGWHTVLTGIAKGSAGGNLYNQQCKTPDVVEDVPVQRVTPDQLNVVTLTKHFERTPEGSGPNKPTVLDLPETEATYYAPMAGSNLTFSTESTSGCIHDPAGTIGAEVTCLDEEAAECTDDTSGCSCPDGGTCNDYLRYVDLHNQDAAEVTYDAIPPAIASGDSTKDGVSLVNYHYEFHQKNDHQNSVEWKWRWEEAVSTDQGGTGNIALELWYFDRSGRLRLHGRGAGVAGADDDPPQPAMPFYYDYTGYDESGRNIIEVRDIDTGKIHVDEEGDGITPAIAGFNWPTSGGSYGRKGSANAKNITTLLLREGSSERVTSRIVGQLTTDVLDRLDHSIESNEWTASDFVEGDMTRTDYAVLSNRTIRYEEVNGAVSLQWRDPYSYSIEHTGVHVGNSDVQVHGTTTVKVVDKGGRFVEQRVIAWNPARQGATGKNMTDKIDDFGWAVSLLDYDHDGAIAGWTGEDGVVPGDNWIPCGSSTPCLGYVQGNNTENWTPPIPTQTQGDETTINWPPGAADQIITLARTAKEYRQASTLKPTHDISYNDFKQPPDSGPDRRTVVREFTYDLEDRIARQKEPDGTIKRMLFDSKRRPTKVFNGSADGCADWFPRVFATEDDDMVLSEERLYNDGDPDYESNDQSVPGNEDFPYDAGRLVRTRRFTDSPEACNTAFNEDTPSRDTQYVYDWRGRAVITKEVVVDGAGHGRADPALLSATATVFDNLDRPVIVATWPPDGILPTLDEIEAWTKLAPEIAVNQVCTREGLQTPQTLSLTLYDERGRTYEQRTYEPGAPDHYTYTRTFRDDLNRVTASLTPTGITVNEYDSLGRVVRTSFCSEEHPDTPGTCGGYELTRTERTYDAFGNVLCEIRRDRMHDYATTGIMGPYSGALITYAYNWYDPYTKRLVATANFGTNAATGYTTSFNPPTGFTGDPSGWPDAPTWDGSKYVIGTTNLTGNALVTLYDYDAAGRRDFVRDPKGIVTKTWFDLLGHTLLVAENWNPGDANYEGPVRYTAHHYTRGGLPDMMVAIIPSNPASYLDITPTSITWTEDADADFAATEVTVPNATVQATRYVYSAELVDGTDHSPSTAVSHAPTLVGVIQYPARDTGQPDPLNALTFKYTVDGRLARRTDQRDVSLDFYYDGNAGCSSCSASPGNQPTEVRVSYPAGDPPSISDACYKTIDHLAFGYNTRRQLTSAQQYCSADTLSNQVLFEYDAFGNLISETLNPRTAASESMTRKVDYNWQWEGNQNRVTGISYPHELDATADFAVEFSYNGQSWTDAIGRMTGVSEVDGTSNPLIAYTATGGGRNVKKAWGGNAVALDYTTASALDRFGRITSMGFKRNGASTLHRYEYGYDANGNRTYAKINQAGHANNRSFLYGYDNLNRLVYAERGVLDTSVPVIDNGGTGRAWNLDVLGNWSGDQTNQRSVIDYTFSSGNPGYSSGDTVTAYTHHDTDATNQIVQHHYDAHPQPPTSFDTTDFHYDKAGNVILDNKHFYKYDAWNRVVRVNERGTLAVSGDAFTGTSGGAVAWYKYDALGRRIYKGVFDPSDQEWDGDYFYYDGHRVLEHRKTNAAGTAVEPHRRYVYGLDYIDEVVAYYDTGSADPNPHFVLQDANYDVVGVTDHQGYLEQQYSYAPYGAYQHIEDGSGVRYNNMDADLTALLIPLGRNGLILDRETGLYYNRARYYDPLLSRFLQADPNGTGMGQSCSLAYGGQTFGTSFSLSARVQYGDGMNLYQYLSGRPVNNRDPRGLCNEGDVCYDLETQVVPGLLNPDEAKYVGFSLAAADVYMAVTYAQSFKGPIVFECNKWNAPKYFEENSMAIAAVPLIRAFTRKGGFSIWYRYRCKACVDPWWSSSFWAEAIDGWKWKRCPVRVLPSVEPGESHLGFSSELQKKLINDCAIKTQALVEQKCATQKRCPE